MTTLETILTILLWIVLGFFICNKVKWYNNYEDPLLPSEKDEIIAKCLGTVLFAPLVFLVHTINRIFIQKW